MRRKANRHDERSTASWRGLRALPELAGCSDDAIDRIDGAATQVTRPAGAVLQTGGHLVQQVVVVLEGSLQDDTAGPVGAGALVGAEGVRMALGTVVATTPVRLLVFGPPEIAELVELVQASEARIRAAADGARMRVLSPALG